MGCGQDVHLKTRTEGVIMKNDKLFVLPTQPLGSVCRDVLLKFLKVLYLTVYLHLCLLLWYLLPLESRQT